MHTSVPQSDVSAVQSRADHVVFDWRTGKLCCSHCGVETERVVLPISVQLLVEKTDAFLDAHKACLAPGECACDPESGPPEDEADSCGKCRHVNACPNRAPEVANG